jgi:isopenicillin-N epimerase
MRQDRRGFLVTAAAGALALGLQPFGSSISASKAQATPATDFWEMVREQYFSLSPEYIYMNNSTFGATLNPVAQRMQEVQEMFAQGCHLMRFLREVIFQLPGVYKSMAKLVNGHDQEGGKYIGIVDSVTEGMSLVANGLNIGPGDVILTTDHEHTGGLTCWKLEQSRRQAQVIEIPLVEGGYGRADWQDTLLARFEAALASQPVKVVSFSYTTTSTGHVLPAKELCALARRYEAISVVDAAQTFAIKPIDMQALGCDFMVVNGHKYLNGAIGSGFVCVNPRMVSSLDSFWGTVVDDNVYYPDNPARNRPYRQGGVQAYTSVLPLAEALAFYRELGTELVYNRLNDIGRWLRTGMSRYGSTFEILTPTVEGQSVVMTCFRVSGMSSEDAVSALSRSYGIEVKHSEEGGADAIRLAPHYYNTGAEFMALATAICALAGVPLEPWLEDNPLDGLPLR